jgi:beta-phosphoglucomutase-like phosphatase (HAD superfamily)
MAPAPGRGDRFERALIFDFDGLIIDTEGLYASLLVEVLAEHGIAADLSSMGHLFGSTGPDTEAAWDAAIAGWGASWDMSELGRHILAHAGDRFDQLPLLPGVAELLDAAEDAGWGLAIATGKERVRLEGHLVRLGIGERFHAVVTAEEVSCGKPAPDIFLEAARRLEVAPERCVVLEDSVPGCQGALAAGMAAVACPGTVTRGLAFPEAARRIETLLHLTLEDLALDEGALDGRA